MPKIIEPLTNIKCHQARPGKSGLTKLYDGGGLYLDVRKTSKKWRLKFRFDNKESTITLGDYPIISLAQARKERDKIKGAISKGLHPVVERNKQKGLLIRQQKETFDAIAEEWLAFKKPNWSNDHYTSVSFFVRKDAYKYLKGVPVTSISAQDVLSVIREIESREAFVLSHRVLSWIGMILSYAVGTGRIGHNVAVGLKQFLQDSPPPVPHPYVTLDRLPEVLYQIANYSSYLTRTALKLQTHLFLRPNELMGARWSEFDVAKKIWIIPANRMKGRLKQKKYGKEHLVPLSNQVIQIINDLYNVSGRSIYLFPSQIKSGKMPMTRHALKGALECLGLQDEQTAHGFRGLASTVLNESGLFSAKAIDIQLAHKPQRESSAELNYNHAQYLDVRIEIMQWWSDYLEKRVNEYSLPELVIAK